MAAYNKDKINVGAKKYTTQWDWDKLYHIAKMRTAATQTYTALRPIIEALHAHAQTYDYLHQMHQRLRYAIDPHSGSTEAYMLMYLSEVESFEDFILFAYGAFCQRHDNSRLSTQITGLHVYEIRHIIYSKFKDKFGSFYISGTTDPLLNCFMELLNLQKISADPNEQLSAFMDQLFADMLATIYAYHVPVLKELHIL